VSIQILRSAPHDTFLSSILAKMDIEDDQLQLGFRISSWKKSRVAESLTDVTHYEMMLREWDIALSDHSKKIAKLKPGQNPPSDLRIELVDDRTAEEIKVRFQYYSASTFEPKLIPTRSQQRQRRPVSRLI
jgi:hypothetical protein